MNAPQKITEEISEISQDIWDEIDRNNKRLAEEKPEWYVQEMRCRNFSNRKVNFHDD